MTPGFLLWARNMFFALLSETGRVKFSAQAELFWVVNDLPKYWENPKSGTRIVALG